MAKSKPTWLAVIVCVIAVIVPGMIIGGIVAYLFRMSIPANMMPDPLGLHGFFGIDLVYNILGWIVVVGLSSALHGGISGAVAVALTKLICPGANIAKAAYITGALYTGLFVVVFVIALIVGAIDASTIATVFHLIGLWIGLLSVSATAPQFEASA